MDREELNENQHKALEAPLDTSIFLEGPAGTGKTTAALSRLNRAIHNFPGYKILIITPQQSLANPYRKFIFEDSSNCGSIPHIATMSSLARQMTKKFWPLFSGEAGFFSPNKRPHFLSSETAQYCMAKIVDPMIEMGYFQSITIERNRLFSQILDNLNKAALIRLPIDEIAERLCASASTNPMMEIAFEQVQECTIKFREICLEKNLIDFSLLINLFHRFVWPLDICKNYIRARFEVLFMDNLEEDTPFTHSIASEWIRNFSSSTLVFDSEGGFRTFLGADPNGGLNLKNTCDKHIIFNQSMVISDEINTYRNGLISCIKKLRDPGILYKLPDNSDLQIYRFYPEMILATCEKIRALIDTGIQPRDIVVLSPYLSDSLKFSFSEKLNTLNVPILTSRPSRMYIAAPEVKSLLAFAKLSHPGWNLPVSIYEFRNFLMLFIPDLDIIRADLLTKVLFSKKKNLNPIGSFDAITNVELQERITFTIGEKIEVLRDWITKYLETDPLPLDIFFQNLYGQVLSVNGFKLHNDFNAANLIERLIQSIKSFRQFSCEAFGTDNLVIGRDYIENVEQGLIPSSFKKYEIENNAVLISPAHTFLMENRPVAYQFWLDIGSLGWWERLYQPLTNPYVFKKSWRASDIWSEQMEHETNQENMKKVVNGLLSRCKEGVIASAVQVNEYGSEDYGPLLKAFQIYKKRSKNQNKTR